MSGAAMAQFGQRKCLCCQGLFFPDRRSAGRQRYCQSVDCRRASKAASQAAWLAKPQNVGYFKGPSHVLRVRAWRAVHPGYGRGRSRGPSALQDPLLPEVPDSVAQIIDRGEPLLSPVAVALQDLLNPSEALMAGLIAHLFELSLQEDMAVTTRRLVQRGQDLIQGMRGDDEVGGLHQARAGTGASAPSAGAVQLG
jgi:hypothetical protein